MNKKWEYYENNQEKLEKIEQISKQFNISNLVSTILVNRGLEDEKEIEKYLSPTRKDFYDPYLMPDMQIAVDRIIEAINNKEKIIIYGDYDVDGITSSTVLKKFLVERGAETVDIYIPNRLNEGYGLNKEAIKKITDKKYNLMITVDCGISGVEEINYANSFGLQTIITDHHEQAEIIPNALAVIDAKRKDNKYPFNQLAGVGVVFKLIQAISIALNLDEKEFLKYLDIVCVGTISDIVPLVDENRVIAKLGLKLIQVTKNVGLRQLINTIGYNKIDSACVSFGLAPRINACGRLGRQEEALNLFLTDSVEEANNIATRLNEYNKLRQDTEKKIFDEVSEIIKKEENKPCIILAKENWHHGIIGIVASKVTEMYFKPTILICLEGEIGKGSGRSIPGFDMYEALTACSKHIKKFGGHSMAIGINVNRNEFSRFKQELEKFALKSNIDKIVPIIHVDQEVSLKNLTKKAVDELSLLEPFGELNKMPLFLFKNLKILSIRALTDGKHLKLTLKDDNVIIDAIGFNMGELASEYLIGNKIDIIGNLEINKFNNLESIQITLKDIRKSYK